MKEILFIPKGELIRREELLEQCDSLDREYFPWPWSSGQLIEFLKKPTAFALTAVKNEQVLGFLLGEILEGLDQFHLYKIIIQPDLRKQGHAKSLISESFRLLYQNHEIKEIYLEVSSGNRAAIELYKEFGLKMIHRKVRFYSDGSDADIMLGSIVDHLFS